MKRISVLIILSLVLVAGGTYWLYTRLAEEEKAELYDALPPSATLFFEIESWPELKARLQSTAYFEKLEATGVVEKLLEQTATMNELLAQPDSGKGLFQDRELLLQIALTDAGEYDFLYLLKTLNLNKNQFQAFIRSFSQSRKMEERTYKGLNIYEATGDFGLLTLAFDRGILMASFTPFLVEEAIEQLQAEPWVRQNKALQKLRALSSGNGGLSAYLNLEEEAVLTELLIDAENQSLKQFVRQMASWMQLEISLDSENLFFNGYTLAGSGDYLNQIQAQQPNTIDVERILPKETAAFVHLYGKDSLQVNSKFEFHSYFKKWMSEKRGFAILETLNEQWEEALFFFIKSNNNEQSIESLTEIAELQDQNFSDEFNGYTIGRLSGSEFDAYLGFKEMGLKDPYFTQIGAFVLLANTVKTLKQIISSYLNGETLTRAVDYLEFSESISSTSNFSLRIQPAYSEQLIAELLNTSLRNKLKAPASSWKQIGNIALQFSVYDDLYFTNGLVQFQSKAPVVKEKIEKLWAFELDTALQKGPFVVVNHENNFREIFLQDVSSQVYLIDRTGKLLWKQKLDGAIMGDRVYQMDYYKNGKLQLVFNTRENIHIIDREGNKVAGFPLKLPVEASNPMLLTNYDNKDRYRYFMAGNNRIYGFYQSGKPLPGWSPKRRAGTITQPMEYCQIEGVDYLIAVNEEGEVFYFDRRGEKKVEPILTKREFDFPFAFVLNEKSFRLYNYSRNDSALFEIDKEGNIEQTPFKDSISFFAFSAYDLDRDGSSEMVFTDSSSVRVYNDKMELLKQVVAPFSLDQPPFQVGQKLGFYSKKDQQLWLLDDAYTENTFFPMNGHSKFVLGQLFKDGKTQLILEESPGEISVYKVPF